MICKSLYSVFIYVLQNIPTSLELGFVNTLINIVLWIVSEQEPSDKQAHIHDYMKINDMNWEEF